MLYSVSRYFVKLMIGQDLEKQKNRVERRHEILLRCAENIAVKKVLLMDAVQEKDRVISEVKLLNLTWEVLDVRLHLVFYAFKEFPIISLNNFVTLKALRVFHVMESKRLNHIKQCLQIFCDLEHELIVKRQQLLLKLKFSVTAMNSEYDLNLFINQNKAGETHHKYSKALALLDVDYESRHSDIHRDQDHYSPIIDDSTFSRQCGNLKNLHSTDLEVPQLSDIDIDQRNGRIDYNAANIVCNTMNEDGNCYPNHENIIDNRDQIDFQGSDQCDLRTILSATTQLFQGRRYFLFAPLNHEYPRF